mmetsp:Transcript_13437/g.44893  ORF Transcript_13437/g.44893 Transcript_13437/m.44893 type:complete len:237 (+) Transcript_13437:88-798(+)
MPTTWATAVPGAPRRRRCARPRGASLGRRFTSRAAAKARRSISTTTSSSSSSRSKTAAPCSTSSPRAHSRTPTREPTSRRSLGSAGARRSSRARAARPRIFSSFTAAAATTRRRCKSTFARLWRWTSTAGSRRRLYETSRATGPAAQTSRCTSSRRTRHGHAAESCGRRGGASPAPRTKSRSTPSSSTRRGAASTPRRCGSSTRTKTSSTSRATRRRCATTSKSSPRRTTLQPFAR